MRWSVRLSVVLMLIAWVLMLRRSHSNRTDRAIRWAWMAGFLAFLVHLWAAFEHVHHWSHAAAVDATARQTKELVGFDWGGGVWLNYLFAVVWGLDVVWRLLFPDSLARRAAIFDFVIHGFLGFIAFNATVVFATGLSRWIGTTGCVMMLATFISRKGRPRNGNTDSPNGIGGRRRVR